jgi:hypothetical protein
MGKYLIGVLGVMVIILVGVLGYRIFLSGEGDTWICDNGGWIKHGSPSTPMPSGECGEDDQEPLTATNQNEQNKVASGEFVARCEVSGGEPELSGDGRVSLQMAHNAQRKLLIRVNASRSLERS